MTDNGLLMNLNNVESRIKIALERSDRDLSSVRLLPVIKFKPVSEIKLISARGISSFDENHVQDILEKENELNDSSVKFEMNGHLQVDKVKKIAGHISLLYSLYSLKSVQELEKQYAEFNTVLPCLIEVNSGKDPAEYGIMPEEARDFVTSLPVFPHLDIQGLMTVAPVVENKEAARPYFHQRNELLFDLNADLYAKKKVLPHPLKELSMDMTDDFEKAIEEGAAIVRIGMAIFGERDYIHRC